MSITGEFTTEYLQAWRSNSIYMWLIKYTPSDRYHAPVYTNLLLLSVLAQRKDSDSP